MATTLARLARNKKVIKIIINIIIKSKIIIITTNKIIIKITKNR